MDVENRKKLGGFAHYRKALLGDGAQPKATPEDLLAQFESLRASGIPVTIRRIP